MRFDRIPVARAKLSFRLVKPLRHLRIFRARVIQFRHFRRERFLLFLERPQTREYRHALGKHRTAGEREPVLRQVADGHAFHERLGAAFERIDTRQNLEQRGFSRPVRAHNSRALVRSHQPIELFEQDFGTEALSRACELNH